MRKGRWVGGCSDGRKPATRRISRGVRWGARSCCLSKVHRHNLRRLAWRSLEFNSAICRWSGIELWRWTIGVEVQVPRVAARGRNNRPLHGSEREGASEEEPQLALLECTATALDPGQSWSSTGVVVQYCNARVY